MRNLTLSDMLDMQEDLNLYINVDWKKERTVAQLEVAIMDELAEFLRSGRKWKWWKGGNKPNIWNEQLEIVDVVHFYLSKILMHPTVERMEKNFLPGFEFKQTYRPIFTKEDESIDHTVFMRAVRMVMDGEPGTAETFDRFLKIFNMTNAELSAIYMAKITLNKIRQDQGYQKGTYKKMVGGLEDNDRLCDIVNAYLNNEGMSLGDIKLAVEAEFAGA